MFATLLSYPAAINCYFQCFSGHSILSITLDSMIPPLYLGNQHQNFFLTQVMTIQLYFSLFLYSTTTIYFSKDFFKTLLLQLFVYLVVINNDGSSLENNMKEKNMQIYHFLCAPLIFKLTFFPLKHTTQLLIKILLQKGKLAHGNFWMVQLFTIEKKNAMLAAQHPQPYMLLVFCRLFNFRYSTSIGEPQVYHELLLLSIFPL